MPRFSVCIPTYNRADILADRLKRMAAMQGALELEISVSDNASSDHTRDVIEQYRTSFARFHYIRQQRLISPNLNFYAALRNVTSDHFTLIGDDDIIMPESILAVLSMFAGDKTLQAVVGNNELFDFSTGHSHGLTRFIHEPERFSLATGHDLFSRFYFFEYSVMRSAPVHRYFHNEGFSYPIGWKLLHCGLRSGAVALDPLPIIYKGYSPEQLGYRNYTPEMQDSPRADPEIFAALMMPGASQAERDILRQAALMRTVRYSSDSQTTANEHKKYLIALHHAQRAAVYDYETKFYPKIPPDELLYGRLAEWVAGMVKASPFVRSVMVEECVAGRKLSDFLVPRLPGISVLNVPLAMLGNAPVSQFVVSMEFDAHLAADAALYPGTPYCALTDLMSVSQDKPSSQPAYKGPNAGINAP